MGAKCNKGTVLCAGAQPFSGYISAELDFLYSPTSNADISGETAQCRCPCPVVPPSYITTISAPAACRPFQRPPALLCNATKGIAGYTYRTASCASAASGTAADLSLCRQYDCYLSPFDQQALKSYSGNSALLPSTCTWYQSCDLQYQYRNSTWGACSDTCWDKAAKPLVKPLRTREVRAAVKLWHVAGRRACTCAAFCVWTHAERSTSGPCAQLCAMLSGSLDATHLCKCAGVVPDHQHQLQLHIQRHVAR